MIQDRLIILPEQIKSAHRSLEPFVRETQQVTRIRRVLALHLSSHVNAKAEGVPISHPLSLLEPECEVGSASGARGIRREYLRYVRANIKARQEYEEISRKHQLHTSPESQHLKDGTSTGYGYSVASLESFLDVIKYRRRHERLRILQDYVDMLAQKAAAAPDHFDPRAVLKDAAPLPSVPSDVINITGPRQEAQGTNINDLVEQLEKFVLRAKLLLKREQKLLSKVRAEGASRNTLSTSPGNRIQALGTARNELINWIETELAKAGESPADSDGQDPNSIQKKGKDYIDSQLSSIQRQYAQYTKARQTLVIAATGSVETPAPTVTEDHMVAPVPKDEVRTTEIMGHTFHPYLEDLTFILNQQKSIIQQKSHLTISLAKQLKEAGQGLDRLAEESHLLPSYPLAGSQRKALETSFGDEVSNHEKPDSSRRARAWVHSSGLAIKATKEAVAEKLEQGEVAILDARQTLMDLSCLLGEALDGENGSRNVPKDIWATLDGHLGVIKRDGVGDV